MVSCDGRLLSRYPLVQKQTRVGRRSVNDIVLDRWSVSGAHAVLVRDGQGVEIQDLGSRNGTYVDGVRVTRCALTQASVVRIADFTLTIAMQRAAMAYEPTLVVRSASASPRKASFQPLDEQGEAIPVDQVVTTIGRPGTGQVTCVRRADDFALIAADGQGLATLNGVALSEVPVRLHEGDLLQLGGERFRFQLG